jgi:hypothetical protein
MKSLSAARHIAAGRKEDSANRRGSPFAHQIASCLGLHEHIKREAQARRAAQENTAWAEALEARGFNRQRALTKLTVDREIALANARNRARLDDEDQKRSDGQAAFYAEQREIARANGVTNSQHEASRRGGLKRAARAREAKKRAAEHEDA